MGRLILILDGIDENLNVWASASFILVCEIVLLDCIVGGID